MITENISEKMHQVPIDQDFVWTKHDRLNPISR